MFKKWVKLFTTDCEVIDIPHIGIVYPVFKNGSSSLKKYAKHNKCSIIRNQKIADLPMVKIFCRDPIERFVSGVGTFFVNEKVKDTQSMLGDIEKLKIYDRHFVPQIFWLFHLYKFYRKEITIRPIEELYNLIDYREKPKNNLTDQLKKEILSIDYQKYVTADQHLMSTFMNKTVELGKIVKDIKYALS